MDTLNPDEPTRLNPSRLKQIRRMTRWRKRADVALLDQDMRMWDLKTEGWTDERIARDVGLATNTVRERINAMYSAYRAELTGQVEAKAAEQVSQLEYIRDEALVAWRASKKPRSRVSKSTTRRVGADGMEAGEGGALETTNVSQDEQTGDPRYLDSAMKAMDKIAQLLRFSNALQVDVQVTHQGADGGPVQVLVQQDINYDELDGDKLNSYLRGLAQASLLVVAPMIDPAQISATPPIDVTPPEAQLGSGEPPMESEA